MLESVKEVYHFMYAYGLCIIEKPQEDMYFLLCTEVQKENDPEECLQERLEWQYQPTIASGQVPTPRSSLQHD